MVLKTLVKRNMMFRYEYAEIANIAKAKYRKPFLLSLKASNKKNAPNNTKSGNKFDSSPHLLFIICHGQIAKKNSPISVNFLFVFLFNNR